MELVPFSNYHWMRGTLQSRQVTILLWSVIYFRIMFVHWKFVQKSIRDHCWTNSFIKKRGLWLSVWQKVKLHNSISPPSQCWKMVVVASCLGDAILRLGPGGWLEYMGKIERDKIILLDDDLSEDANLLRFSRTKTPYINLELWGLITYVGMTQENK